MHIITTAVGALVELALMVLVVAALGVAAAAGYTIISMAAEIAREKIIRRRQRKNREAVRRAAERFDRYVGQ